MKRKILRILFFILFFIIVLVAFRKPIFRSLAALLIVEDTFQYVENAFVLSGGAYDRANAAAMLFQDNKVGKIFCTGENLAPDVKVLGFDYLESELSKKQLLAMNVPESAIRLLPKGTSTYEEALAIRSYCSGQAISEIVVVSSKFHTRRIALVFKKMFKKEGITVLIQGAPSSSYVEMQWWQSENGLIALNNEYIKLLYYLIKY